MVNGASMFSNVDSARRIAAPGRRRRRRTMFSQWIERENYPFEWFEVRLLRWDDLREEDVVWVFLGLVCHCYRSAEKINHPHPKDVRVALELSYNFFLLYYILHRVFYPYSSLNDHNSSGIDFHTRDKKKEEDDDDTMVSSDKIIETVDTSNRRVFVVEEKASVQKCFSHQTHSTSISVSAEEKKRRCKNRVQS